MTSAESDLIVVSLVRYADSCEPADRHGDCPFAVETHGVLSCHEECRGVIRSLLRRGRGEPTSRSQAFDARQLRLSEPPGSPDIRWHTSSLIQVVAEVARTNPLYPNGSINLKRLIDATSALAMLGSRGLDPELILRRGVAESVKLALAVGLEKNPGGLLDGWEYFPQWRAIFEEEENLGGLSAESYLIAIFRGQVAERINGWIESSSIEDIILWRPPNVDVEPIPNGAHENEKETWGWLVERFTGTYLDRWSLSSLKREYGFIQGSWRPDFSTEVLAERVLQREEVASALADRAVSDDDLIDPATMLSFVDQAEVLLRDGQRSAAAAVFNAARTLKPQDLQAQNNYAFCILIDRPEEAKGLLEDIIGRGGGMNSLAVLWCNLALAEWLIGQVDAALVACERAYESDSEPFEAILWMRNREGWVPRMILPRLWAVHFGAELERSTESSSGPWAKRLEDLNPLQEATSSDPSSGEKDGEDL